MEKFFETNRKTILTIAGIGATAALIALAYKNIKNKRARKETPFVYIKIEYNGSYYSAKTMKQIMDAIRRFSIEEYSKLIKKYRSNRRAKKDELKGYISVCNDFNRKLDEYITKWEKEAVRRLDNVSEVLYYESIGFHKSLQVNELARERGLLQGRMRDELKSTKTISFEELKKILKSQIEFTKKAAENKELVSKLLADPKQTVSLLVNQILDQIYSKYTVEEEDIKEALSVHGGDPQIRELVLELQLAVRMLIPDQLFQTSPQKPR